MHDEDYDYNAWCETHQRHHGPHLATSSRVNQDQKQDQDVLADLYEGDNAEPALGDRTTMRS